MIFLNRERNTAVQYAVVFVQDIQFYLFESCISVIWRDLDLVVKYLIPDLAKISRNPNSHNTAINLFCAQWLTLCRLLRRAAST